MSLPSMMNLQAMFTLEGKTALVTGGSRGVGAMIAEGLVAAGCRTYICSRTGADCERTAEQLGVYSAACIPLAADISSVDGIEALVAALSQRESAIDILVNNAGVAWGEPLATFPEKGWDRVMNLNARSVFFLTQKMLPLLKRRATAEDPSRVINTTSVLGSRPDAMMAYSYCASKAALEQMTRNLAYDLAADNITVNGISPGFFPSKMTAHIMEDEAADRAMLEKARFPRHGRPEEVAGLAIYLCSRSGAYVTGDIIPIDGGMLLSC
jgi:NAD(P)-dependent dehydrogenase (short-subunit alcohol dehydrogenase family)